MSKIKRKLDLYPYYMNSELYNTSKTITYSNLVNLDISRLIDHILLI